MSLTRSEPIWLLSFLASLGIFSLHMQLYCDSQATLHVACNSYSMSEQNILKSTVILFRRNLKKSYSH